LCAYCQGNIQGIGGEPPMDTTVFFAYKTAMTIKELLLQEIEKVPEPLLQEVLDFIQFLQNKHQQEKLEITLLSESSLQKDWLSSQEEEAWQDL